MRYFLALIFLIDIFLQSYMRRAGLGVANGGISFGLWPSSGGYVSMVIYLFFLAWFVIEVKRGKFSLCLLGIALGGLGNLIPRLFWGNVWDYLSLSFVPFMFNLSDVLITMGVVCYVGRSGILEPDGNTDSVRRQGHSGN